MSSLFTSGDTETAASYGIGKTTLSVAGAVLLIALNIGLMLLVAPTAAADLVIWLYEAAPFDPLLGIAVMSVLLSVGRYVSYSALGYDPIDPEETSFVSDVNLSAAVLGLIATQLAFGLFGGAALAIVPPALRTTVIGISVAVTGALALIAGGAELITKRDLAPYGAMIHGGGMVGGVALLIVGWVVGLVSSGVASLLYTAAFALIVIGWLGDMVHEISVLTRDDRSVAINAYGLYAAITGVLVHIIWMVARAYAEE